MARPDIKKKKYEEKQEQVLANTAVSTEETEKEIKDWKRQTYYIPNEMIEAIRIKAFMEKRDKSDIVRSALEAYVEAEYRNKI